MFLWFSACQGTHVSDDLGIALRVSLSFHTMLHQVPELANWHCGVRGWPVTIMGGRCRSHGEMLAAFVLYNKVYETSLCCREVWHWALVQFSI